MASKNFFPIALESTGIVPELGKRITKSGLASSVVSCSKKSTCSVIPAISNNLRNLTSPQFPLDWDDPVNASVKLSALSPSERVF